MSEKQIIIEVPQGYEIDKEKSTFEKIVFKKKEVEFQHFLFDGAWIGLDSKINTLPCNSKCTLSHKGERNICISEDFAEAVLAMKRLGILMASPTYNGDWVADWEDDMTDKYIIYFVDGEAEKARSKCRSHFLSFKTEGIRDRFLNNHRDLILEAKILL